MSEFDNLKDVVKDSLERSGALPQIKARLRAEIFHSLSDNFSAKPTPNSTNILINELIREYLKFNDYKYTASVLSEEADMKVEQLDRNLMQSELGVADSEQTRQLPLLYAIIGDLIQNKDSYASKE